LRLKEYETGNGTNSLRQEPVRIKKRSRLAARTAKTAPFYVKGNAFILSITHGP